MNPQPNLRVASRKIGPDDRRYADLVRRGFNQRFSGKPDYVQLVGSTDDVVDAVGDAARNKLRIAVRSGGHCLEGFVADPAVRVVVDTSLMTAFEKPSSAGGSTGVLRDRSGGTPPPKDGQLQYRKSGYLRQAK